MRENTSNKTANSSAVYLKLFIVLCLAGMFGCKAKKHVITTPVSSNITVKPTNTKVHELEAVKAGQTYFNTFSGKARTKLDINGNSNDVTLNIRIKRDQKIWVSITAIAGIEVARALITPDSILVINRLQSVYLKKPFSYVYKFASSQVNYKTVETLLTGNVIPELLTEQTTIQSTADTTRLSGNLGDLIFKVLIGAGMKSIQTSLNNHQAGQSLLVNNSTFVQNGTKVIPSQIDISSVVKDKRIQINLRYIKTDFDLPLEYPFSIPARYEPAAN